MSDWRDERRELNRFGRFGLAWWLVIVLVIVVIGAVLWGVRVATSGVRGQGDAIIQKNSASNWTAAQARFEQNYQEVVTSDQKIQNAYDTLQTDPSDATLRTNYDGLKSYCLSVVADYNADARSYLAEDFRAADLPSEISNIDQNTDCKESTP